MRVASSIGYMSTTRFRLVPVEWHRARELVLAMKTGDAEATHACAKWMAIHHFVHHFEGTLVPVPGSKKGTSTIALCRSLIEENVGSSIEMILTRIVSVESSRMRRRRGLEGVPLGEHAASISAGVRACRLRSPVMLVDDVMTVGTTLLASARVLREAGYRGIIRGATAGHDMTPTGLAAMNSSPWLPAVRDIG